MNKRALPRMTALLLAVVSTILLGWRLQTPVADTHGGGSKMRTWTDSTGGIAIEAELFFFDPASGKVYLRRVDGQILTVPVDRLSETDQQRVRSFFGKERVDPICGLLFEEYVRGLKVDGFELQMACELIASRGRKKGFGRVVLAELRRGDERTERTCVLILGKMLAEDARARDIINSPGFRADRFARPPGVGLGEDVVDELIRRTQRADDDRRDDYVIALARSRDPRSREFLRYVVRSTQERREREEEAMRTGPPAPQDPRQDRNSTARRDTNDQERQMVYSLVAEFYSAVGLAQLGDPMGIEWLIAHHGDAAPDLPDRFGDESPLSQGRNFAGYPVNGLSSAEALRSLTGQNLTTRAEWQAWWQKARKPFVPRGYVRIPDK